MMTTDAPRFEKSLAAVAAEHGLHRIDVGYCAYDYGHNVIVSLWWADPREDVAHGVITHCTGYSSDLCADEALDRALTVKAAKDAQIAALAPAVELAA